MIEVKWRATKNSEREALRRCGPAWRVLNESGSRLLIESQFGPHDLRWIERAQVLQPLDWDALMADVPL